MGDDHDSGKKGEENINAQDLLDGVAESIALIATLLIAIISLNYVVDQANYPISRESFYSSIEIAPNTECTAVVQAFTGYVGYLTSTSLIMVNGISATDVSTAILFQGNGSAAIDDYLVVCNPPPYGYVRRNYSLNCHKSNTRAFRQEFQNLTMFSNIDFASLGTENPFFAFLGRNYYVSIEFPKVFVPISSYNVLFLALVTEVTQLDFRQTSLQYRCRTNGTKLSFAEADEFDINSQKAAVGLASVGLALKLFSFFCMYMGYTLSKKKILDEIGRIEKRLEHLLATKKTDSEAVVKISQTVDQQQIQTV